MATKEDGKIKRRRGGENQTTMKRGGDKSDSKGGPIVTARVNQPANDEVRWRVGGDSKEDPETAVTATAAEKET